MSFLSQGRPLECQAPFQAMCGVWLPLLGSVGQFLWGCFSQGAAILATLALGLSALAWANQSLKGKSSN